MPTYTRSSPGIGFAVVYALTMSHGFAAELVGAVKVALWGVHVPLEAIGKEASRLTGEAGPVPM